MTDDRWPPGRGGTGGGAGVPLIDITPGQAPPVPAAGPRRHRRTALAAVAALAVVTAAGAGYAAVRPPERVRATVLPVVPVPTLPFGGMPTPVGGGSPAADPVAPSPSRPATIRSSPAPARTAPAPARSTPAPVRSTPAPVRSPAPVRTPPPSREPSAVARLAAEFTGGGRWTADGLTDYGGTIRLDNAGTSAARGWRLTLTVPGGHPVYAGDPVTVTRDGDRVTVTPAGPGGAVPPGGSLTVWYWIDGVLPVPPSGCAVNGHPCS